MLTSIRYLDTRPDSLPVVVSGWGDYLRGFAWAHFATFTSEWRKSPTTLLRDVRAYVRSVERIVQHRVGWFAAVEEDDAGWGHVHALISGTERLTTDRLAQQWRSGFARVRCYDPSRRGAHYVVKQIELHTHDWEEWYDLALLRPAVERACGPR